MQLSFVLIALLFLPVHAENSCGASDARLQWSRAEMIKSPGCEWTLQIVPPTESEEDKGAFAYLEKRGERRRLLFRLERDGVVHWQPNGRYLLLEDKQSSDHFRLRLFPLGGDGQVHGKRVEINSALQSDILHRLQVTDQISYYLPRFVKWSENRVIVSVGVMTTARGSGPFTPHCFGYSIALSPFHIQRMFDDSELKAATGSSCQTWP